MLRWIVLLTLPTAALAADPTPQIRASAGQAAPTAAPRLIVVQVHADWCAGCRRLGDLRAVLGPELADLPVQILRLDLTDDASEARARVQARAAGVEAAFEDNRGRTGVVLLVDPTTGAVLSLFTALDGAEKVAAAVRAHLG